MAVPSPIQPHPRRGFAKQLKPQITPASMPESATVVAAKFTARVAAEEIRPIVLVGFMGCGKSTVGGALARRLGWHLEDIDLRVERAAGKSVAEVFLEAGELGFREMEHDHLQDVLREAEEDPAVVLALGGGTWVPERNRSALQNGNWITVFLDAPVEELWQRCRGWTQNRPLAADWEEFARLYALRKPLYQQTHLLVSTAGKLPETVAGTILKLLPPFIKGR